MLDGSLTRSTLQICQNIISERYAEGVKPQKDLLGSFKKHGITAEEAETELTISL